MSQVSSAKVLRMTAARIPDHDAVVFPRLNEDGTPQMLTDTSGGRYAALHDAWVKSLA